jgi:tetraacyldisaccharide 4'-kinase
LNKEALHRLMSGQSQNPWIFLLRMFLLIPSFFYFLLIKLRNFLYSAGWLKTHQVNAVVISVGNITTGGTGKTPLVAHLVKY